MSRLQWAEPGQRFFETGLDQGVIYLKNQPVRSSISFQTIATGPVTWSLLVLDVGLNPKFKVGTIVKAVHNGFPSQYMIGEVTASEENMVTLNVTQTGGSGTLLAGWSLQRVDVAIPWNGLTGVDENGGGDAATYYIDGRPFLNLPKPKEYSASVRAYTYPDEFSEIQGVVEATDGMYLDSQQADSFDLSYRTLVGNDIDGPEHGYKIHLVYNATVVPQNIGRATNTDVINMTEFSWNIQAVPVIVEGYLPTAHIIIDTRHMDSEKLSAIEDLLYGTGSTFGLLPPPQDIFDILSYGDTIVIHDNGDGTWEARGSRNNLYMIGDQIFRIDNVNATDNGDGTYTFSTGGNTVVT